VLFLSVIILIETGRSKTGKMLEIKKYHFQIRRHKEKIDSEEAKALLRQRGILIERIFGYIKEHLGCGCSGSGKDHFHF
jgi:hypothetical protein